MAAGGGVKGFEQRRERMKSTFFFLSCFVFILFFLYSNYAWTHYQSRYVDVEKNQMESQAVLHK